MRIRVALAASDHVAVLSIYLSSRGRKGIHLKFIVASAEKIYAKERGKDRKKVANFLSHEMRVSGACHGVMLGINFNDKGVEDTRLVRRSNSCVQAR